ncbi:hypothetical protein MKW94_019704 [Papaver nudicaule]|uniref:Uncharacterized protein n=1 Tax=Papaver nudicaule TaxID=74823 RepID=A0AA41VGY7_PAPNU|nr:hypothetical protein [Papaver nudicaule]
MSSMPEMAMSPALVASNGQFPFTSSDISGMGVEASVLDNTFPFDVGNLGALGNYPGSPFFPSDSDIISCTALSISVQEFYVDNPVQGHCSQSDEDKP